ncbi:hypothetical protein [uncultured Algibacter sp.]|uniref:hypothetical protein n=1 Tax=uncultured Algibacter sp. TaxID=298659 RepID=UPI0026168CED|nr:hypothetical protein [uncultured Algibacter sp.]
MTEISNDVDKYQLHQKIDDLYMLAADTYSNSELYNGEIRSKVSFDVINKDWKYWNNLKAEKKSVLNQLEWTFYIKTLIFILGSIFLIIPKFREEQA